MVLFNSNAPETSLWIEGCKSGIQNLNKSSIALTVIKPSDDINNSNISNNAEENKNSREVLESGK